MGLIRVFFRDNLGVRLRWVGLLMGMLLLLTATAPRCQAQTFSEFFRQKKTQKKYLLEQIAALHVYADYVRKGYQVVGSGLKTVRDITSGEFDLHEAFISGLKKVAPVIKADPRVAEIMAMQLSLMRDFRGLKKFDFSADELGYVSDVADLVLSDAVDDLEELLLVVTSGKVEMNDSERLDRLEGIFIRMLEKSGFARRFCAEAEMLLRAKENEKQSIEKLRRYYGID